MSISPYQRTRLWYAARPGRRNKLVIPQEAQQAMEQWLSQATPPEQQLDRRWIERYRELNSQDSFWWLSWAGPFTQNARFSQFSVV
jgi:hypothetical protein